MVNQSKLKLMLSPMKPQQQLKIITPLTNPLITKQLKPKIQTKIPSLKTKLPEAIHKPKQPKIKA